MGFYRSNTFRITFTLYNYYSVRGWWWCTEEISWTECKSRSISVKLATDQCSEHEGWWKVRNKYHRHTNTGQLIFLVLACYQVITIGCAQLCLYHHPCALFSRLDNVEARFQETSEAFEQVRQMAKKTKSDFEKIKKLRCIMLLLRAYFKALESHSLLERTSPNNS